MEMEDSSSIDPHSTILVKLLFFSYECVQGGPLCHDHISGSVECLAVLRLHHSVY